MVNVPLIDKGIEMVTPVAFVLFIIKLFRLAIGLETRFEKVPEPEIV